MKKVFAFAAAAVAVGFASCSDEKEASVASVNYEECTFVLSTETAEISQDLTRAVSEEEPRMVSCYFPNAKGNKKFLVEEGNQLTVLLPAGMQSTGYFVQADEKNDFTADSDFCIDITKSNEHVYSAKWIGTPENSQGTDITLTRRVGKFTAVQGTINDGYSIIVEVVGDQFYNWVDDSPNGQRVTIFNNA